MKRMITNKLVDKIKSLFTVVSTDDGNVEIDKNLEVDGEITTNGYINSANIPLHSLIVKAYDADGTELTGVEISIFVINFVGHLSIGSFQKVFIALNGGNVKSIQLLLQNGDPFCDLILYLRAIGENLNDITSTTTTNGNEIIYASTNSMSTLELLTFRG